MNFAIQERKDPCSSRTTKVRGLTLLEIAGRFNSPLLEEHAWAVCYLCANKLVELQCQLSGGCCADIAIENTVVTLDGSIELLKGK